MDLYSRIKTPTIVWSVSLLCLLAAVSLFWLDSLCNPGHIEDHIPGDLKSALHHLGGFGHGIACLLAMLLIWTLDPERRGSIKLVFGSALLAGIIASLLKILVQRPRPFVSALDTVDLTVADSMLAHAYQSFPSGHSATAFALAMALSVIYPKGSKLFCGLAIATGLQRVVSNVHFPSDVFAGAAIGILSTFFVLQLLQSKAAQAAAHTSYASRQSAKPTSI